MTDTTRLARAFGDHTAQSYASDELDDVIHVLEDVVRLLRAGQDPPYAYALVYQVRWLLGVTVRKLGYDAPRPTARLRAQNHVNDLLTTRRRRELPR